MKSILYISTIVILLIGCGTQKGLKSGKGLLTERFQESDSVGVILQYRDLTSCSDDQLSQYIFMYVNSGETRIVLIDSSRSKRTVGPIKGRLLPELKSFEMRAKDELSCGEYAGGHGIVVSLTINDEEHEFGYCKDRWDGIGELIAAIEIRKGK